VTGTYLGQKYGVNVPNLNEVPSVMFQLYLRQTLMNSGLIHAMPWEEHIKKALGGTIPGVSEVARVDATIMRNIADGREVALAAIRDCTSYSDMARELRLARDTIKEIDSYFYLEFDFFCNEVPGLIETFLFADAVKALSTNEPVGTDAEMLVSRGEQAYKLIAGISASAEARYSLPTVGKAITGAMLIVKSMIDGESVVAKAVQASSEFHKKIYEACSNYLVYFKPGTATSSATKPVRASAAMAALLKQLEQDLTECKAIDLGCLKVFRQFRWLLSPSEDARIQKLIVEERRKRQNMLETHMIKDAQPGDPALTDAPPSAAAAAAPAAPSRPAPSSDVAAKSSKAAKTETEPPKKKLKPVASDVIDDRMKLFMPKWMAGQTKPE